MRAVMSNIVRAKIKRIRKTRSTTGRVLLIIPVLLAGCMNQYDYSLRGLHRMEAKNFAGAEGDFLAAIQGGLDADYYWLGVARAGAGKYQAAADALRQAFAKNPDDSTGAWLLAVLILANEIDEATRRADDMVGFFPPASGDWRLGVSPVISAMNPQVQPLGSLYRGLKLAAGDAKAVARYDQYVNSTLPVLANHQCYTLSGSQEWHCKENLDKKTVNVLVNQGLDDFARYYQTESIKFAKLASGLEAQESQASTTDNDSAVEETDNSTEQLMGAILGVAGALSTHQSVPTNRPAPIYHPVQPATTPMSNRSLCDFHNVPGCI